MHEFLIEIADRQSHVAVDHADVRCLVARTLADAGVTRAEISVALVDHAVLRPLNVRDLGHDYETDVLSYRLDEGGGSPAGGFDGVTVEGEVVVDCETAAETVRDWAAADASGIAWNAAAEVLLYVTHGVLHVVGYDDATEKERTTMRTREAALLGTLGLTPPEIASAAGGVADDGDDDEPGSAAGGRR
ncbi:MAG: rRNA maturation RNase YbeY [Planctomycetota bacterium]